MDVNFPAMMKKLWTSLTKGFHKLYRGLLCEKKEGEWELSKGNVAFWIVLWHCMMTWSGKADAAVGKIAETAAKAVGKAAHAAAEEGIAVAGEAGLWDALTDLDVGGPVPQQEYWFLLALLSYATIKHTKGSMTNLMNAVRGNGK